MSPATSCFLRAYVKLIDVGGARWDRLQQDLLPHVAHNLKSVEDWSQVYRQQMVEWAGPRGEELRRKAGRAKKEA